MEKEKKLPPGVRRHGHRSIFGVAALVGLLTSVARAENPPGKRTLAESLREPWLTLGIGLYIDQGDDMNAGPYLLLQRISPSQLLLSRIDSHRAAEPSLPIAISCISEDEAARLIQRALVFYATAGKELGERARVSAMPREQRETMMRARRFGGSAAYITFDLLGPGIHRSYSDDFADESDSMNQFHGFLEDAAKKRR